jgi:hypothetical protein
MRCGTGPLGRSGGTHQRLKQIRLQQIGLNGLGWLPIYCVVGNKIHGVGNFLVAKPTMDLVPSTGLSSTLALLGLETRSERVELAIARCFSTVAVWW